MLTSARRGKDIAVFSSKTAQVKGCAVPSVEVISWKLLTQANISDLLVIGATLLLREGGLANAVTNNSDVTGVMAVTNVVAVTSLVGCGRRGRVVEVEVFKRDAEAHTSSYIKVSV